MNAPVLLTDIPLPVGVGVDLDQIVNSYDTDFAPAPATTCQPDVDTPASGWIVGLKADNGKLFADIQTHDADFAEKVRSGQFGRVLTAVFGKDATSNPKQGKHYLKHVAFLDGARPGAEVEPAFASDDEIVIFAAECEIPDCAGLHFAMPEGFSASDSDMEFHRRASMLARREGLDFVDAVIRLEKENKNED